MILGMNVKGECNRSNPNGLATMGELVKVHTIPATMEKK